VRRLLLFAAGLTLVGAQTARAVFIDLRGLPGDATSTSAGGIAVQLAHAGVVGSFTSTPTRFGFDAAAAGDAPQLFDGGAGVAERVQFVFQTPVYIDSIVISEFGAGDAGTFTLQNGSTFQLAGGVNNLNGAIAAAGGSHEVLWTGANTSGLGFSVDGLNVRPVAPFSADFNSDSDVDGADLLIWQRGLGPFSLPAVGNANFDMRVDGLDLQVWRLQFGGAMGVATAVPEPAGAAVIACALALVGVGWRRRVE
jgi:hypothetical protein